jgi:hypothetical protein
VLHAGDVFQVAYRLRNVGDLPEHDVFVHVDRDPLQRGLRTVGRWGRTYKVLPPRSRTLRGRFTLRARAAGKYYVFVGAEGLTNGGDLQELDFDVLPR